MKVEVEFTGDLRRVVLAVSDGGGEMKEIISRLAPISPSRVNLIVKILKDMNLVDSVRKTNTGKDHGRLSTMPMIWSCTDDGIRVAGQLREDLI